MAPKLVVISGCSGAGKSTLLGALAARGHAVFEEPGRRVVKAELASGGEGLPWVDAAKFASLCIELGLQQHAVATVGEGVAFFDRSIVDAFNAFEAMGLSVPIRYADALGRIRYEQRVFMTPPWAEIYRTDAERKHSFTEAVQEFEALTKFYARHGYDIVMLPKVSPAARADFVLGNLG